MTKTKLRSYEAQLTTLRDRLRNELTQLIDAIPEASNAPGEPSHLPTDMADVATEGLDKHFVLVQNDQGMLEAVEEALKRIREGTYGTCRTCGTEIAEARLEAIPYAADCIGCAQQHEGEPH